MFNSLTASSELSATTGLSALYFSEGTLVFIFNS